MEIRHINAGDDRLAISRIYEESWKFAYRGIIPQSYLDSIPSGRWAAHLDTPGRDNFVMLDGSRCIGTASCSPSRSDEYKGFGEIISIYLLPEYIGRGHGRPLLEAAVCRLEALGFRDIFLWVLEANCRARAFYEKFGFHPAEYYLEDTIGGKPLREIQYRYHID